MHDEEVMSACFISKTTKWSSVTFSIGGYTQKVVSLI